MTDTLGLYRYAEEHGIDVDWCSLPVTPSFSVALPDGSCCVAVDPWKLETLAEENVCLAHELGHCETGAFYNPYTRFDVKQRHENRADRWAIKKLIPEDELREEIAAGYTEPWQLAERFDVTESFMLKALHYYAVGNLAV